MAEKNQPKLKQTVSSFTLKGIVDGLGKQNAFRTGEVKQGKNKGKSTQALTFLVQTSKTNKIRVELFGMEPEFVYISKDGQVEKGKKRETKSIPYAKRNNIPEGWSMIGISTGLEKGADGKNIVKTHTDYDAAEYIYENLNDGDSVFINGRIVVSEYTDKEGKTKTQVRYQIGRIYLEGKPLNLDAEDFKETCAFEQEIVIVDTEADKKEGIVIVTGRVINYGDKYFDTQFIVRPNGNPKIEKTAKAFLKTKFGDFIKVQGLILNRAEVEEAEDDGSNEFGGERPVGARGTITTYTSELQITYAEGYEKAKYTEEDFEPEEELVNDEPDFGSDSDDDDDLPF